MVCVIVVCVIVVCLVLCLRVCACCVIVVFVSELEGKRGESMRALEEEYV